ncbi:Z1 domain-containing protein [Cohnella sp. WQ 127256]|uniref:Z1 domain-containing protein n=1 Tax=Cohnella sp. WQ 127256 TaxID=2938790 RepID=UPI002119424C|nr:Z1 domain-containing protein [Cohnella sp. WQ 127256]
MSYIDIIEDGFHVNNFKSLLVEDIGENSTSDLISTAKRIFKHAPCPEFDNDSKLGLLYGLVQSGKTNIINMTIAIASDNGYKFFILLTDNNNDLQQQTLNRSQESLQGMYVNHISTILYEPYEYIKETLDDEGVVVICKKNPSDLTKLLEFIDQYEACTIPTLIIDDEADAVGLNTNQRFEDKPPSTINQHLKNIISKQKLNLFLQVTATPQAIILQTDFLSPSFVELATVGNGYIGLETLFLENRENVIRELQKDELTLFTDNEIENFIDYNVPIGIKQALCSFYVAATLKMLTEIQLTKKPQSYSFLCHISPLQKVHEKIKYFIDRFKTDLKLTIKNKLNNDIYFLLREEYLDLTKTFNVDGKVDFEHVLLMLSRNLVNSSIRVLNSSTDNEINSNYRYNILIGGNKFSRGLTIPRLLTTYYGRHSTSPQVDTLIQHARMCGYRSGDLDVTRIFIPNDLADLFETVSIHDKTQREIIDKNGIQNTLYLDFNKLKPTRPNVIPKAVGAFQAGSIYFPKVPEFRRGFVEGITKEIDNFVTRKFPESQKLYDISVKDIIQLLNKIPVIKNGGWNSKVIVQYLDWLSENNIEKGHFYYSLDNDIGYSEKREGIGAILSEEVNEFIKHNSVDTIPMLILYRLIGNKSKDWEGERFWIPMFKFPKGQSIIFNLNNVVT